MNAKAAAVAAQVTEGTVLESLRKYYLGDRKVVVRVTEKSVYFEGGTYENKRSLHWYKVVA